MAVVDSAGRVTGVTAGHARSSASAGDLVLELPIEVFPVPTTITLLAGDGQRARRGSAAVPAQGADRVARRAADGRRPGALPRSGADRAASHPISIPPMPTASCSAVRTLGDRPGRQRSALAVDGEPPIATRSPRTPSRWPRTRASRRAILPRGEAGLELAEPIMVRVTDSTGAPLGDVPVVASRNGGRSWRTALGPTRSAKPGRAGRSAHAGLERAYVQVGVSRAVPRAAPRRRRCRGRRFAGPRS